QKLGPVDFEVGVIAGNRNWRPLVSKPLEGEPSDGTVTVAETKVAGMSDFLELPATHTLMMWQTDVLEQIVAFLTEGRFIRNQSEGIE
ncbi:MAG: alpha/beta hydrolase, partial [Pseudomonadota bacterium]